MWKFIRTLKDEVKIGVKFEEDVSENHILLMRELRAA
jgi:hypothetical protein